MRLLFASVALLFVFQISVAQKVTVENGIDNLADGYNASFRVSIPHAAEKLLSKRWESFLKDNHAKVKSTKGGLVGHHTVINGLSMDTMEVFSKISGEDGRLLLTVAFQRGTTFVSATNDASLSAQISRLLKEFGVTVAKEGVVNLVENATGMLKDMVKEQNKLTNDNKKMSSDNERMKKEISDNESQIQKNKGRLEELKTTITNQQAALENTKALTKELE